MGKVEFQDFSFQVKAAINQATQNWLEETATEIEAHAKLNCSSKGWEQEEYTALKNGYKHETKPEKGVAIVGHRLEMAYWEEFGTGEYADAANKARTGKGSRAGWWIYTPGYTNPKGEDSRIYPTQEAAEEMAEYIRKVHGKVAIVTNGRRPNYTLEKAFKKVRPKQEARLAALLGKELE